MGGSSKLARLPALLTGPPISQLSTRSRTKDSAAAAGLSPPWEPWRALTLRQQASWEATLNSSWWIATPPVDLKAATVVSTSTESNTLALPALLLRAHTRTLPLMAAARPALFPRLCLREPSLDTTASARPTLLCSRLLPRALCPSLWTLTIHGNPTDPKFFPRAAVSSVRLTMPSSQWAMTPPPALSRSVTRGVPHGARVATCAFPTPSATLTACTTPLLSPHRSLRTSLSEQFNRGPFSF